MTAEPTQLRFLRDRGADAICDETQSILDQLRTLELEIDYVFGYVCEDTTERVTRACETLSRIEAAINLLRQLSPPPAEAIQLLITAATDIQSEQRMIREGLTSLLRTIRPESDPEEEDA